VRRPGGVHDCRIVQQWNHSLVQAEYVRQERRRLVAAPEPEVYERGSRQALEGRLAFQVRRIHGNRELAGRLGDLTAGAENPGPHYADVRFE